MLRACGGRKEPKAESAAQYTCESGPHAKALKDSKVKPFVLYSLRHTMLTRLGEAGADAFAIQKIAGHSSIVVSQRYVHPTPGRLESAFAALEAYNAVQQQKLEAGTKIQ